MRKQKWYVSYTHGSLYGIATVLAHGPQDAREAVREHVRIAYRGTPWAYVPVTILHVCRNTGLLHLTVD